MVTVLDTNYDWKRIEFCCDEIATALLLTKWITFAPYSNHFPRARMEGHNINFCPYCGSQIRGKIEPSA